MNYKIKNAVRTGSFESKFGPMIKYTVELEGEDDAVEVVQKPDSPAPSGEISGTIEDTQYGRKFKKDRPSFGGSGAKDPEVQKYIIRQNALTNAVNYCVAKANLEKGFKLTGKEVIQVATYFAKYSEGKITVVTEDEKPPVQELPEEVDIDKIFE